MENLPSNLTSTEIEKVNLFNLDKHYSSLIKKAETTDDIEYLRNAQIQSEAVKNICERVEFYKCRDKAQRVYLLSAFRLAKLIPDGKGGRGNKLIMPVSGLKRGTLNKYKNCFKKTKDVSEFHKIYDAISKKREGSVALEDFNSKNNEGNLNTEYYTPAWLIEGCLNAAGIDQFDLDPASCPEANEIVNAKRIFTKEDDALSRPWREHESEKINVWCNPPYTNNTRGENLLNRFATKFLEEGVLSRGKCFFLCPFSDKAEHFRELNPFASCIYVCSREGKPLKFRRPECVPKGKDRIRETLALYCFGVSYQSVNFCLVQQYGGFVYQVKPAWDIGVPDYPKQMANDPDSMDSITIPAPVGVDLPPRYERLARFIWESKS